MTQILEYIQQSRQASFVAASPDEFFALRLACRLGDGATARHYALLASQYAEEQLLGAYAWAVRHRQTGGTLGELFHTALGRGVPPLRPRRSRTLSVAIERRHVAAAVFNGTHVEDVRLRHLPGQPEKMAGSAVGFVRSMLAEHRIEGTVLEVGPGTQESKTVKAGVIRAVSAEFRQRALPRWQLLSRDVISAFGYPAPTKRTRMRQIGARMWPDSAEGSRQSTRLDALALGLYAQTERLLTGAEH